ncbi:hypothetical protein QWY90_06900 [Flavobacterium paronense]|uniref:DUF3300 domain-containing protein n=1 Tax=Flavobacterium paronense TaxID=1392775 RepID=A0ABV5GGD9_9FLAO|nr:hypothetical protein [Flavobacterium paronense]MDN3677036.1 hypothetical protein [Flavobacterium paronense]
MKTKILSLTLLSILSMTSVNAQDRTTVTANNSEISDNLDLRAVASIFGDSENLDDFERRLNDPKIQISNLDLNRDNKVDYLRVIETIEGNAHLIVIQSVLGRDSFQDIATVEVERDRNNRVQVQVVGDVYMYGNNYIYEPVYAYTPVIYTSFWVSNYHPYYSSWNWGFYPSFYFAWTPFPIYTYQNHINICINNYHHYNYVNYRRCDIAYNNYYSHGRRGNAYERENPTRSFEHRNNGYANRYELDNNRRTQKPNSRNEVALNGTRNNSYDTSSPRNVRNQNGSRDESSELSPRTYSNVRSQESPRSIKNQNDSRDERRESIPRTYGNNRTQESPRSVITQNGSRSESSPRSYGNQRSAESPRSSSTREFSQQRGNSQRSEGNSRGNANGNRRS